MSDAPGCDTLELLLAKAYGGLLLCFVDPLISPAVQMRLGKSNEKEQRRGEKVCVNGAMQGQRWGSAILRTQNVM